MNNAHMHDLIFDYANGTLGPQDRAAFEAHLASCPECTASLAPAQAMASSVAALPRSVAPPRDLWPEIATRLDGEPVASPVPRRRAATDAPDAGPDRKEVHHGAARRRRFGWTVRVAAVAGLVLIAAGVWRATGDRRATPPGEQTGAFEVIRLEGAPRIGAERLIDAGRIHVGEWLETDRTSRAQIDVAEIGNVQVGPETRVGVLETHSRQHRLALSRGTIEASIWAPPRLFIVETPSSRAIDLGCAYTLRVDSTGGSRLDVTAGWVALEHEAREIVIPAGAACLTRPGRGPGIPFDQGASDTLRAALARFESRPDDDAALQALLDTATPGDVISLWYVMLDTEGARRGRVFDRLTSLDPPPDGVTREGIVRGDASHIDRWERYLGLDFESWELPPDALSHAAVR